jgi:hypothetical protein
MLTPLDGIEAVQAQEIILHGRALMANFAHSFPGH